MVHRLSSRGLTAEYTIDYQIGAGILGHSYITAVSGYFFQSPVTWFRSSGWDVSPGYGPAPAIDFDRPITETCLFCHAAGANFYSDNARRPRSTSLTSITCERCHGRSDDHVRQPTAKNIVNPRRLPRRARDSVCEQCHLEGAVRVLNPGKNWSDFRPGMNLEQTVVTYVLNQNGPETKAVSQVEQLAQSQCALQSEGKLWCGSCHRPHARHLDRQEEIRSVCQSCHASLSRNVHPTRELDCTGCHMPRVSSEYAHVAVTDHRILRRPQPTNFLEEKQSSKQMSLAAWVEPPREFRQRDLLLAELTAGSQTGNKTFIESGLRRMEFVSDAVLAQDAALLASSCETLLTPKSTQKALDLCRRSAELQPSHPDRALAFGRALLLSGNTAEAEQQFLRAIRLDPSLKRAYMELWTLYDSRHNNKAMMETADRYLNWNPRGLLFRRLKAVLEAE